MDINKLFASVSSASIKSSGCKGKTIDKDDIATMETCLAKFAKGRLEQHFLAKIHCHKLGNDDDLQHWQKGTLKALGAVFYRIESVRTHFSVEAFYKDSGEYAFTLERVAGGIRFSDDEEKVEHIYVSNKFVQKEFTVSDVINFTRHEVTKGYNLLLNNCKDFAYNFFEYVESGNVQGSIVFPFPRLVEFKKYVEVQFHWNKQRRLELCHG